MSEPRIIPSFHSNGSCPTLFALDLARAMRYSGTLLPFALHEQGCYVEASRNKLVKTFLQTEGTHMMMIDVDISFEADAFLKTFTLLEQYNADVLYGNYALGNSGNSIFGPPENAAQESAVMVGLKPDHVYDGVATGGTGWVMMRRGILERMQKECPGPWHWFARDPTTDGTDLRGEDISFGLRLYHMTPRPKVMGTTAILLRHLKNQPFIPDFMGKKAAEAKVPALCFPNPYENDPRYLVTGYTVVDKAAMSPEQLAQLEEEFKQKKEAENASSQREAETVHGTSASQEEKGQEDPGSHE